MADEANTGRLTAAEALVSHVKTMKLLAGLLLKAHRDYKAEIDGKPGSLIQKEVAKAIGTSQTIISNCERGKSYPNKVLLEKYLVKIGFGFGGGKKGGKAMLNLLLFLKSNRNTIKKLPDEKPART